MLDVQAAQAKNAKTAVFSKRYTGKDGALRRIAHKISDDLTARLTGEQGVASTRIVYVREVSRGIKEIFQVDRDGAGIFALTAHRSLTISPTVAADGRLAYVTYKGGAPEIWGQRTPGGPHVKLYPLGGKNEGHCFCPSWSPDGKRLALVQGDRRGNTDIVVLDVASGRVRRLTDSNCINTDPSWNPAGTQLAFTSDREGGPQVFLMGDDGSNVRRLTQEGTYNGSLSEMLGEPYRNYFWTAEVTEVATNKLFKVECAVQERGNREIISDLSTVLFRPLSPAGSLEGGNFIHK